jgi:hypothetical protein
MREVGSSFEILTLGFAERAKPDGREYCTDAPSNLKQEADASGGVVNSASQLRRLGEHASRCTPTTGVVGSRAIDNEGQSGRCYFLAEAAATIDSIMSTRQEGSGIVRAVEVAIAALNEAIIASTSGVFSPN